MAVFGVLRCVGSMLTGGGLAAGWRPWFCGVGGAEEGHGGVGGVGGVGGGSGCGSRC